MCFVFLSVQSQEYGEGGAGKGFSVLRTGAFFSYRTTYWPKFIYRTVVLVPIAVHSTGEKFFNVFRTGHCY